MDCGENSLSLWARQRLMIISSITSAKISDLARAPSQPNELAIVVLLLVVQCVCGPVHIKAAVQCPLQLTF